MPYMGFLEIPVKVANFPNLPKNCDDKWSPILEGEWSDYRN